MGKRAFYGVVLRLKAASKEISLLLCYLQAHSWFKGMEWEKLYQIEAAFIPEVNDELDTQNFEKFEEVGSLVGAPVCCLPANLIYSLFLLTLFCCSSNRCRVTTKFPLQ